MSNRKSILAIIGSAGSNSANQHLVQEISSRISEEFTFTIYNDLKTLPHFDPELSIGNPPKKIIELRNAIEKSDGILICSPEYIFSIPSGLKNAIEWCIATTIFSGKPCGLVTASASGKKGHAELKLIMKTVMAKFTKSTTLLIPGIKGKFDSEGNLNDDELSNQLDIFTNSFMNLIKQASKATNR